jgi:hypothetical protein
MDLGRHGWHNVDGDGRQTRSRGWNIKICLRAVMKSPHILKAPKTDGLLRDIADGSLRGGLQFRRTLKGRTCGAKLSIIHSH